MRCLFGVSTALSAVNLCVVSLRVVLYGAVQYVAVLKILKEHAEPSRSHQGQICYLVRLVLEYSAASLKWFFGSLRGDG